jgi:hypothetical protein
MTWRRKLRRRLLWAGLLLGLVLLYVTVSVLRFLVCSRDLVVNATSGGWATGHKGGKGMSRKLTLVIGIAAAALAVVPAAYGEGRLAGSIEPDAVAYYYANEHSTLAAALDDVTVVRRPDSHDIARTSSPGYVDAGERSIRIGRTTVAAIPTGSVSSGSGIEWPQLGIGFGLGILLAASLWLAVRMTRSRPLAH